MLNFSCLTTLAIFLSLAVDAVARETAGSPLFQDDAILELTITAPFPSLLRRRTNEEYLPGRVSYSEADGNTIDLEIGIRTRGNYRRQKRVCPFPPLRINMKKQQLEGTIFHRQDKLKLVVHCRDRSERYEQGVIREYLAYRILNLLTDKSHRVRLLRVRYIDSEQKQDDRTRYAFFIEHKDRLAKRLGLEELAVRGINTTRLVGPYSDLTSLFQFFIGNTDFSPIAGAKGENCCHNTTLFNAGNGLVYAIPYDFDMSGFVDAPYAEPNPRFKLRSVTERLYRGRCEHVDNLDGSLRAFRDNRDAIYALIGGQPELLAKSGKAVKKFVDQFYRIIDDPQQVERQIVKQCI